MLKMPRKLLPMLASSCSPFRRVFLVKKTKTRGAIANKGTDINTACQGMPEVTIHEVTVIAVNLKAKKYNKNILKTEFTLLIPHDLEFNCRKKLTPKVSRKDTRK